MHTEKGILKCPTGIEGLDEITCGGLPRGRASLVCGAAGCGKTMLAMQFLINGAVRYDEPGVFMCFEETEGELTANFASLGADFAALVAADKLRLDYVRLERSEISETGEYDLEGLFVRLDYAIRSIGAKRVAIDTIEVLFSGLSDVGILRAELRRLFHWLKDRGVTAVVTAERSGGMLTRHGIEEYVSDCVLVLDHKVAEQISTRRLRVLKYRGSTHGTNEYPFLIDEQGFNVMPITSVGLDAPAPANRISSGSERLDHMLGGGGYYAGSSILISGTAGTGKTTLAALAVDAACRRGDKCLFFAFEESPQQIGRNLRSVGLDLGRLADAGLLEFSAMRPTLHGLEMHLVAMYKKINAVNPKLVVIDPVSSLTAVGNSLDVKIMLTRLMDFLKNKGVTLLLLNLSGPDRREETELGISSLADTWIALRDIELGGERNRGLYILKSRGMAHSNQIREFVLSDKGIELLDVYTGAEGALTGTARYTQEAKEAAERALREEEIARKRREIDHRRQKLAAAVAELEAAFEIEKGELEKLIAEEETQLQTVSRHRSHLATMRKADK